MPDTSPNYIDFEKWSTLAISDPEKFEQLRQAKIAEFIERTDQERQIRLRGLQWTIDKTREKHQDSSVGSCLALSKLMWKTFSELSHQLKTCDENEISTAPQKQILADIIPFGDKLKA